MDIPKTTGKPPTKQSVARKEVSPLPPLHRQAIQATSKEMSVSEASRRFDVSRPTIYRWLARQDTAGKSRKPKSVSSRLKPIQRDAIAELVRLTRLPRAKLLPSILQVFPVFGDLTPNGQRRVWSAVLGKTGCLPLAPLQNATAKGVYVSRLRIGALWLGDARQPDRLVCCLWASEEASGFIVHRVVESGKASIVDFLQDLSYEWRLSVPTMPISSMTMLTGPDLVFPDRGPQDQHRSPRISWEQLQAEVNQAFAAGSVPNLLYEVSPTRPRTLWLRGLKSPSMLVRTAKQGVTKHLKKYNLWDGEQSPTWGRRASKVRPLDDLIRRAKRTNNNTGGNWSTALHQLASRPLVRYSERKRAQEKAW